jgi:quercetin dioxygenase-like cupin family protein
MALHHASPGEVVDLGHSANSPRTPGTRAIVKTDRFEAMRLVMQRGDTIPAHQVASQLTLHCLQGEANVKLADRTLPLRADQWVFFAADTVHVIDAVADTVILMTIMLPIAPDS